MPAGANDKFTKSYSFLQKSLGATITDSATSLTLNNYTNIPTDTKVHFIIDRIDSNGNRTNSTRELVSGISTGSAITNLSRGLHGTTAQAHNAGAVVEFVLSGAAWNDLIDGLLAEHNQDGTHSDVTATSVDTDTLVVNTGTTLPAGDIGTNDLADGSVTNAKLATGAGEPGGAWGDWTPSFTNLTVGNGTFAYAKYKKVGRIVHARFELVFGSTTSIGSNPIFSLPVAASSNYTNRSPIGMARYEDTGVNGYTGIVEWETANTAQLLLNRVDGTYLFLWAVNTTTPFTWAAGDSITVDFKYEAAA